MIIIICSHCRSSFLSHAGYAQLKCKTCGKILELWDLSFAETSCLPEFVVTGKDGKYGPVFQTVSYMPNKES